MKYDYQYSGKYAINLLLLHFDMYSKWYKKFHWLLVCLNCLSTVCCVKCICSCFYIKTYQCPKNLSVIRDDKWISEGIVHVYLGNIYIHDIWIQHNGFLCVNNAFRGPIMGPVEVIF